MYNLELCDCPDWKELVKDAEKPGMSPEIHRTWIWSEGKPLDITRHNGYRVILLGKPSFARSSKIQRTFNNLKASF